MTVRLCQVCGVEKDFSDFYKNRKGLYRHCKTCYMERNKGYQAKYRSSSRFAIRMRACRARAKERNLPFNLTTEYLESIWTGVCPVFNEVLDINALKGEVGHAQVDKVIPELGYVEGNVYWLSQRANRLKNNARIEDLERLLAWLKSVSIT